MADANFFAASTPQAQGVSASRLLAFLDAAESEIHSLNSFILLRHGAVVAETYWEPYGREYRHSLFSLSKSFTSTAIGLLVAEGKLSEDDRVLDFFPDEAPDAPDERLKALRVRHLLTMTTGHDPDPTQPAVQAGLGPEQVAWTRSFFALPLVHEPGTHFVYNSLATYMLSAIAQRLAGQRILHYLEPRLFAPLGIEGPTWEQSPQGIDTGGWGLSLRTHDIARFGQLYLQRGAWRGRKLLPAEWVARATAGQVPNGPAANADWEQGYGYQFWRCRHNAFRGDGAFGQFCVVLPEQDAVVAITAGVANMQAVLDLVWLHLLPAMGDLPGDAAGTEQLAVRLASARLAPVSGQPTSPLAAAYAGRRFALDANPDGIETIGFDFGVDETRVTLGGAGGDRGIAVGAGRWLRNTIEPIRQANVIFRESWPARVAACGAWVDDNTYVVDLCWYETPFRRTLTCRFDGDGIAIDQLQQVAAPPEGLPSLQGRLQPGG